MMRHEFMRREKFVRKGKLWGDLGNVRAQRKLAGTIIIQNLKIQNYMRKKIGCLTKAKHGSIKLKCNK
jgi:hypothetical protein